MHLAGWLTTALIVLEATLQAGLSLRVLMRRLPTAVTTSWIVLILFFPVVGVVAYLLVGESRIGRRRLDRERTAHPTYERYIAHLLECTRHMPATLSKVDERIAREASAANGLPMLTGNSVELLTDADACFERFVSVIDEAERSLRLEFFIWHPAGRVCGVAEALLRARERGVECRLLVDAVGSRPFLRSGQCRELRGAGVRIASALPPRIIRTPLLRRIDHRNHRKLLIADDCTAMMGSMNMADPRQFKAASGVGEWVDLMAVVRGPAVEMCSLVAIRDWEIESGERLDDDRAALADAEREAAGRMGVQVVPSGPGLSAGNIQSLMLSAIYSAERRLTITTPYFVPDQSIVTALQSAARRGVEVTLVVPLRSDARVTYHAGRAFFGDLLDAGVTIAEFDGGLLHTKSLVVDDEVALFGTVNIDPRSFWLNYELTMIVYDNGATRAIREVQERYIAQSRLVDAEAWKQRSIPKRVLANVAQLFAPLL